jgi:hypothetical protein
MTLVAAAWRLTAIGILFRSMNMATSKLDKNEIMRRQIQEGSLAGREWAVAAHPADILTLIDNVGWWTPGSRREPWNTCPFPDLEARLKANGRFFTLGFLTAVGDEFQAKHHALLSVRHREGELDGQRWATEFATQEQIIQLGNFATATDQRRFFTDPSFHEPPWTPAHELVACLLGSQYPIDEDDNLVEDCQEFRTFWQPFVTEPMDQVISNLKLNSLHGRHKLQDPYYVAGFIDGALGLSEQIRQRLSESATARPSTISHPIDA